jgi:mono/diheme cytochrome c family protein
MGSGCRAGALALKNGMLAVCALLGGCSSDGAARMPDALSGGVTELGPAQTTADGRPILCERDRDDSVRAVFCGDDVPTVSSLAELQALLGLVPGGLTGPNADMYGADSFVNLLSHSTSLSGSTISALNPRMIVIGEHAIMAYERGVQRVEVIAYARNPGLFNFYLFQFELPCDSAADGCKPADLFTPSVEHSWSQLTVRDDEDLANTVFDCRACHQRGADFPQLLMRELESPWTHFFRPFPEPDDKSLGPGVQGHDLLQDYLDAKGDEPYGGFRVDRVARIAPFVLQSTVTQAQPVLFDAPGIENERYPYDDATGYPSEASASPTWEEAYAAFKRGDQLALPYVEQRASDADKQAALSRAYQRYRQGELPDLADIFPDDPQLRARIGLQSEPDATAEDTLIQACGSCHNDVLDQSLSRAKFNIDLWQLDASEITRAIERIERAPGERGVMPPPEARQLDPEARQRLLAYLREDPLLLPPDRMLQRAARVGMTQGAERRAAR